MEILTIHYLFILLYRLKYVHWLQKFMAVDIYGECGPLSCGTSRNMGHSYQLKDDPCFDMVNRKYRWVERIVKLQQFPFSVSDSILVLRMLFAKTMSLRRYSMLSG